MTSQPGNDERLSAVRRAEQFSPFLRAAMAKAPRIVDDFLAHGTAQNDRTSGGEGSVDAQLRRQRQGLALTVALGDLSGDLSLENVTRELSDFADYAIDRAVRAAIDERVPGALNQGFAVIAMGKLGSYELNYSSDVDLLFLFDPETLPRRGRDEPGEAAVRIGRRVIEILQKRTEDGYVARVDLRLRPSPEVTPIALSVNAAISHYESSALPWERAAFIRARACAGDIALGQRFLDAIQPFVWRRSLDYGVIEEIREISARIRDHYAQGDRLGPGYDLKRGRGGIREVEFFTQIQQMIHGGRDPSVRAPATLDALASLQKAGRLECGDAKALADAYRLLRTVEHRAQMVEDAQTHLLPQAWESLDDLAALHGVADGQSLIEMLRPHVDRAEALFDSLAPDREGRLSNDPAILGDELNELGFTDPQPAIRRIADWRSGKPRSLRSALARNAFEAMLPSLLRAIAAGPDPERALNRFSDVVERLSSGINLYRLLEARPPLADRLALILTHAPPLADMLARRPDLLDGLIDESSYALRPEPEAMTARLTESMADETYDHALDRARRVNNERRFALGVQLISGHADPLDLALGYSNVAEGTIVALADATAAEFAKIHGRIEGGELMILALGRLGGRALTHASDLDIIYLFEAPAGAVSDGAKRLTATDYYNRLANRVSAALSVPTASGPLYEIDTRLRPQGAQGMLAVTVDSFLDYQRSEAWTWEHMAMCRARPVYALPERMAQLTDGIETILRLPRDSAKTRSDAAEMRLEMARHKAPSGPLDIKLGPGGLVDLEFVVHTLQLIHGAGLDPRLEYAIAGLAQAGLIDPAFDSDLRLLSRMLVVMRLAAPGSNEPPERSRPLVASLCGHDNWDGLLEAHNAARQRIAQLWQQVREG